MIFPLARPEPYLGIRLERKTLNARFTIKAKYELTTHHFDFDGNEIEIDVDEDDK